MTKRKGDDVCCRIDESDMNAFKEFYKKMTTLGQLGI